MSRNPDDLLQQAIAAARAGQKDEAKALLVQILKANPRNEQAWVWMSATVDTDVERIHCLKQVLAINPNNQLAQKGLRALNALEEAPPAAPKPQPQPVPEPDLAHEPEAPLEPEPPLEPPADEALIEQMPGPGEPDTEPEPLTEPMELEEVELPPPAPVQEPPQPRRPKLPTIPPPPAPGGIPLVEEHMVTRAQRTVEPILSEIRQSEQPVDLGIDWAPPEKMRTVTRRGGIDLRPSPLMLAIGAAVLLVAAIVFLTARLIENVQRQQRLANITPSAVPSITPTSFPTTTPRPTRTPTPASNQPIVEPTLRAPSAPRGEIRFGITATPPYVATGHPASPRMNDAIVAYHEGRYQDALDLIEASRSVDDPIDSYYYEALSLIGLGRYSEAQDAVTTGLQAEESFAPLHYVQGLIYLEDGADSRARQSLERAIEIDPSFIAPRLALSNIYFDQGDLGTALQTALDAQAISQYDVNVLVVISRAYLASGDPENAAAYGNLAAYIDPGSAEAVVAQARGRLALGYNELAAIGLENYQEQVGEGDPQVWALLGEAYGKLGRTTDAQMAYARAIQLSDEAPQAFAGRGLFYLAEGRYQAAFDDLQQAINAGADTPEAQLGYGEAAFYLGDFEAARRAAESVLTADPDNTQATLLAIQAATEAEDDPEEIIDQAIAALSGQEALTLEQQGVLYEAQARALYRLERYFEAQSAMEQAMFVAETGTRHYYNGLILAQIGRVDEAIQELEWVKALDQSFDYPFSDDLNEALDDLYQQREESSP